MNQPFPVPVSGVAIEQAFTYQLHLRVSKPVTVQVGRLGRFRFPAGDYVYTGTARRQLAARVRRHLAASKTLRWHIDYLLAARPVKIVGIHLADTGECELNQSVNGDILVPGFGASDCRSGCGSHLKYQGQNL